MASVDRFVPFDDVHFIKRGWINCNRISLDGGDHLFTVPLEGASQNRLIHDTLIVDDPTWRKDLLKTLERAYRRAPNFGAVLPVVEAAVFKTQHCALRGPQPLSHHRPSQNARRVHFKLTTISQ
jgi:hypothetical protein